MFNLVCRIPKEPFAIAVSGGLDSMTFLKFISMYKSNKFTVLHFNHGTEHGADAEKFVTRHCYDNGYELIVGRVKSEHKKGQSLEEYWRNERYAFFSEYKGKIITCHHLSDAVETWIFSSLNGNPKLIPATRGSFIRPFLASRKEDIIKFYRSHGVTHIEDPSNSENNHNRNIIRNLLMPQILKVNPGIHTTIRNKIIKRYLDERATMS